MNQLSFNSRTVKIGALVVGIVLIAQLLFIGLFSGGAEPEGAGSTEISSGGTPPAPVASPTPARGSSGRLTADAVAALPEEETPTGFVYNAAGKRDPFRPFDFSPKDAERDDLSPLERYEIGQLKLTAVLDGFEEPTAIVENAAGRGFTVRRGTKIGPHGGTITEVLKDKLLIVETTTDFAGVSKTRTIELPIRTKDQKENL
jgi:type IV pilus assembly protein PilP